MNLKILTVEQLKNLLERLYDMEAEGEDVGVESDKVVWELHRRGYEDDE